VRRKTKADPVAYGGLAGWLFADVALVLSLAFLSSQVVGRDRGDGQTPEGPAVTTTLPPATPNLDPETDKPSGAVDVKEILLKSVCVKEGELESLDVLTARVQSKLLDQSVSEDSKFGVILVYAGYRELEPTDSLELRQSKAKGRAEQFRDTIRGWSRLSKERWVKDLGHDGGTDLGCYKLYLLRQSLADPTS